MNKVFSVKGFEDNYFWVLRDSVESNSVYVFDPGQAAPIVNFLIQHNFELKGIFVTHKHFDHVGGIQDLLNFKSVPVYGPDCVDIPCVTNQVFDGMTLELGGAKLTVIHVPGHTDEHMAYHYFSEGSKESYLFSGDFLFAGGCGRLMDDEFEKMWASLGKLKTFPSNTLIYCSHEYTLSNLKFALFLEPDNLALLKRFDFVKTQRENNIITLPTMLDLEMQTNPFLRCNSHQIKTSLEKILGCALLSDFCVFKAMRLMKNTWKA